MFEVVMSRPSVLPADTSNGLLNLRCKGCRKLNEVTRVKIIFEIFVHAGK